MVLCSWSSLNLPVTPSLKPLLHQPRLLFGAILEAVEAVAPNPGPTSVWEQGGCFEQLRRSSRSCLPGSEAAHH